MAHYCSAWSFAVAPDNNSMQPELQHIGMVVCCNLHCCRFVAVVDDNKLVAASGLQSKGQLQKLFFLLVFVNSVHSLQLHDCDLHGSKMKVLLGRLKLPKPQALM